MVRIADVLQSINGAFPIFSYGERHIDEFLGIYAFSADGVAQQWEMFDRLSKNVLDFLRARFPLLGDRNRAICCELQMVQLREKITRIENEYGCYSSIIERSSLC